MDNSAPEFIVSPFEGSRDEFLEKANEFFKTNSELRGYKQLLVLIDQLLASDHAYYQTTSDGVVAGLSAVRLIDNILFFDVFVVESGFREVGLGDEMFSTILAKPEYKSAQFYESRALPGDRHTKNFFETRKGKAQLLVVRGEISSKS